MPAQQPLVNSSSPCCDLPAEPAHALGSPHEETLSCVQPGQIPADQPLEAAHRDAGSWGWDLGELKVLGLVSLSLPSPSQGVLQRCPDINNPC